jgi:DNA-binding response OmpR family regulator
VRQFRRAFAALRREEKFLERARRTVPREMSRAMADHRVDLIILDVMLPGEDGLGLCRKVARTRRLMARIS